MSGGLKQAAGHRLRAVVQPIGRSRWAGFGAGTLLATFVHSGPTTAMAVDFVDTGLLSLVAAVPLVLGANVGTTLAMQLVSFRLDDYCFVAIALGLVLRLLPGRHETLRHLADALLGFGVLFLGMRTMSDAVIPLREGGELQRALTFAAPGTVGGILFALVASTLITGLLQSSGAVIGVLFVLAGAGALGGIEHALPYVLGAHIGACTPTLFVAMGASSEGRRAALAHLLFNVLGAVVALALWRGWIWLIPHTASGLTRQIANAHTLVQLANALLVLPWSGAFAGLVRRLTRAGGPAPETSHLDERRLETPEAAIVAALRETRRMLVLARRTMAAGMKGLVRRDEVPLVEAAKHEGAVDELKRSIGGYLLRVAGRRLSRRQALVVQQLQLAVADVERIGDHATRVAELARGRQAQRVWFDDTAMAELVELYRRVAEILDRTAGTLDPDLAREDRWAQVEAVLALRDEYAERSRAVHARLREQVLDKCEDALTAIFHGQLVTCFDKMVRHAKTIALVEHDPKFFVKRKKLGRHAEPVLRPPVPDLREATSVDGLFEEDDVPAPPAGPKGS
jgi:phosphate:Na+ symporter